MLTKEECYKALRYITNLYEELYITRLEESGNHIDDTKEYWILEELINEHFELQLTANECDLIILGLMKLENELGWDVTLLIKKVLKKKYISPTAKGVVDCVEID